MYNLEHFTLRDMTECGAAIRQASQGVFSMEAAADRIVRYLHDHLVDASTGDPSSVLVRFFKTHAYERLPESLRCIVQRGCEQGGMPPHLKCLTLLATAGERLEWNTRTGSLGHQVIPLPDREAVEKAPMIARLMQQFGVDVETFLNPESDQFPTMFERGYSVFHVATARNSPHIPAQREFVIPMRVQSVLGFGGVLPSGHLFAIIIFSRSSIPPEVASMFKTIALSVKIAALPFDGRTIFETRTPAPVIGSPS